VTIRTFHARRGRLGPRRLELLNQLSTGHPAGFLVGDEPVDLADLFGRSAPVVLEIGSGMGDTTAKMAQVDPARDYLAVEIHSAGVADLLALDVPNVRVAAGDAIQLVRAQLAPSSLDAIHVFFPDPWPKARHQKRRLIQPVHMPLLVSRLVPGGALHCATDAADYAEQMLATLSASPELRNDFPGFAPRPDWRPITLYERRALTAGRGVFDLSFHRVSS
jgi:tRNA (guanine-N7-)-methyltransferase